MHIQIILGSIRKGRVAKPVGDWVYQNAKGRKDATFELIDLKEWDLPMFNLPKGPIKGDYEDPAQQRWAKKIDQGDGYVFVCPEYNHGYPSVLKNAVDYLYAEWVRKPASFVSYGGVNGARSVEQLRLVVIELQMAPLREALHIPDVWGKVEKDRFAGDSDDTKQLSKTLDDLVWWTEALRKARGASSST